MYRPIDAAIRVKRPRIGLQMIIHGMLNCRPTDHSMRQFAQAMLHYTHAVYTFQGHFTLTPVVGSKRIHVWPVVLARSYRPIDKTLT